MLTKVSIVLIDIIAGLALFSFIRPVSRARFEEITGSRLDDVVESWEKRGSAE